MILESQPNRPIPHLAKLHTVDFLLITLIFCLLMGIFWLTASMTFLSGDELVLYDTTQAMALRGNILLSITGDLFYPGHSQVEPLMPWLASVLLKLAYGFQNIGNTHATLLFNPIVTSATACLLYLYARRLRYSIGVGVLLALLFATTTIALPYTKNFFREPLFGFLLLLSAYAILSWREILRSRSGLGLFWLFTSIFALFSVAISKEAGLAALPFLVLVFFTYRHINRKTALSLLIVLFVTGLILVATLALMNLYSDVFGVTLARWKFFSRFSEIGANWRVLPQAIAGFLVSPGKSIFLYSPILVLAFGGVWLQRKQNWLEYGWQLLFLASWVLLYAAIRGLVWFGGTNWGPRYLVPLTPLLMISTLPVLASALQRRSGWRWAVIFLAGVGLLVQLLAVCVNPQQYYRVLDHTNVPGAPWTIGIWTWQWSAIWQNAMLVGKTPLDLVWASYQPQIDWLLLLGILAWTGAIAGLIWWLRKNAYNSLLSFPLILILPLIFLGLNYLALRRIYPDVNYSGQRADLQLMRRELEANLPADTAIYLNSPQYRWFMMNYFKGKQIWYTLEANTRDILLHGSVLPSGYENPNTYLNSKAYDVLNAYVFQHQFATLLTEKNRFVPNDLRANEWYLHQNYFYLNEKSYANDVRVVNFATRILVPPNSQTPVNTSHYRFGDAIQLLGFDVLPIAAIVERNSAILVSSQWKTDVLLEKDYVIGTFLIGPQGVPVTNVDSQPLGGYLPTTRWEPGRSFRNNTAVLLPANALAGRYEVWLLVYDPASGERLLATDATGTLLLDHVLLASFEVLP